MKLSSTIPVYLQDTRGVELSRYMKGNTKLGDGVYTYSRLPGRDSSRNDFGTCPGSSDECETICYAKRIEGVVRQVYAQNSYTNIVPPIPDDCRLLRLHVSGDFNSEPYIRQWINRITERPDVTMWTYTRSWRIPSLLGTLEILRSLPNVQLFASMDKSIDELPPEGWRRAWIDGDERAGKVYKVSPHTVIAAGLKPWEAIQTFNDTKALICPEQTDVVPNCEDCQFCFKGVRNDVVFLQH